MNQQEQIDKLNELVKAQAKLIEQYQRFITFQAAQPIVISSDTLDESELL